MKITRVRIINGPSLNFLGKREPDIYGYKSLDEIIKYTQAKLQTSSCELSWFQTNSEGEIIDILQETTFENCDLVVINPGGYTHSSVAILDALKICKPYKIEVHLSNTNCRENFRKVKITSSGVDSVMEGFGPDSYHLAVYSFINKEER